VVLVRNASGHYVFPSSQNDATALTHARIQSDLISDLSGVHTAPEANAYPIAGYSYMITPTREGFGFTRAKGAVLGKFILYAACAGQKQASQLGYSPLTPVLVRGVFAAVRRIPGAPTPPPLSKCANPTLHGGASQGPTGNQGGSNTTGGSGPTSGGGPKQHSKHHQKPAKTRGGTTPATSGATPTVGLELTANQLSSRRASALKALGGVKPGSSTPLALAILDVLAIALCPWIIWHRRRRADSGGVSSNVEGG
jgi:hypothetical protein